MVHEMKQSGVNGMYHKKCILAGIILNYLTVYY